MNVAHTQPTSVCQRYQPSSPPGESNITLTLEYNEPSDLLTLSKYLDIPINPDENFTTKKLSESIFDLFEQDTRRNPTSDKPEFSFQHETAVNIFQCVAKTPPCDLTEDILTDLFCFFNPDENDVRVNLTYSTLVANIIDHLNFSPLL